MILDDKIKLQICVYLFYYHTKESKKDKSKLIEEFIKIEKKYYTETEPFTNIMSTTKSYTDSYCNIERMNSSNLLNNVYVLLDFVKFFFGDQNISVENISGYLIEKLPTQSQIYFLFEKNEMGKIDTKSFEIKFPSFFLDFNGHKIERAVENLYCYSVDQLN